jgi:serpin B
MTTMMKWLATLSVVAAVPADANTTPSPDQVVAADRDFTFDLAKRIDPGENAVFSPASLQLALAMTDAGAKGKTADELARALHLDRAGDPHEQLAALTQALAGLDHDEQAFHIVNRLYGANGMPWNKAYLDLTAKDYGAALEPLDFRADPDGSRKHINAWVEDHTNKKIVDLLPGGSITSATRMVLADAVYFKGAWMTPFDQRNTKDDKFFVRGKTAADVKMMVQGQRFMIGSGGGAHILELPYAHGDIAMDVILPDDRNGLASVEAKLDGKTMTTLLASMTSEQVDVALPKFQVRTTARMKTVLTQLGIRALFTRAADLTGMVDSKTEALYVDDVYHQGFVAVDENGTEAAAATAVVARAGAAMAPTKPVTFRADHPFAWCIRDLKTGEILFYGRVVDPR